MGVGRLVCWLCRPVSHGVLSMVGGAGGDFSQNPALAYHIVQFKHDCFARTTVVLALVAILVV